MSEIVECPKCRISLEKSSYQEGWTYFIGNNQIPVSANILRKLCPKCYASWECEEARKTRNEAFVNAIDKFWKDQLKQLDVAQEDVSVALHVAKILVNKLGKEKKRQVAAELGRWLSDCSFIGN